MKNNAYKLLDDLNIKYEKLTHPPLFTCEDAEKFGIRFDGLDVKNLFIRNQNKSSFYLVIIPFHKRANLAALSEKLGETKLSFASEQYLLDILKTKSGSVSLLNIANTENPQYTIILDSEIIGAHKIGFHPSDNTETLVFESGEIPKILNHKNVQWKTIEV